MRITNKHGLPEAFVRAVQNDPYSKGDADFSVTGLLAPPRQTVLISKHKDDLEEDAKNRVWSTFGQSVHYILQKSARPGDLVEKRFFADFEQFVVSGAIDLLEFDTLVLSDWKVTKAWAFSKKNGGGKKPEWIAQMNMQLELLRRNGYDAKELNIVAILKDWDAMSLKDGYPPAEIVKVDIPMWPREKTVDFILERIQAHKEAEKSLPSCSSADTWSGRRCESYCAAAPVCEQYQLRKSLSIYRSKLTRK